MATNRSKPAGAILPTLIYDDVPQAIAWLCDVFGFTERLRAGTSHAQLNCGAGGVLLGQSRVVDECAFRQPRPNEVNIVISVDVEDLDRHYEHALARGARILQIPASHVYGERQYTVEDFAGYRWTFSQTVADVDPAEWGAT